MLTTTLNFVLVSMMLYTFLPRRRREHRGFVEGETRFLPQGSVLHLDFSDLSTIILTITKFAKFEPADESICSFAYF